MTESEFIAVAQRLTPSLLRVARRIVGRDEATDVVQNAIINVWQASEDVDDLAACLRAAVENAARDYVSSVAREASVGAYCDREQVRPSQATEDDLIRKVDVRRVVDTLPEDIRYAVWTVYAEGATWREAADDMGVEHTVLFRRVRKWLPYLRERLGATKQAASPSGPLEGGDGDDD